MEPKQSMNQKSLKNQNWSKDKSPNYDLTKLIFFIPYVVIGFTLRLIKHVLSLNTFNLYLSKFENIANKQ